MNFPCSLYNRHVVKDIRVGGSVVSRCVLCGRERRVERAWTVEGSDTL